MTELILIGAFTAFFLAVLEPLIAFFTAIASGRVAAAILSLLFSGLGNVLIGTETIRTFVLMTVAGAFIGSLLITIAERVGAYKPVVVNPIR